jgi:mRNA deadenylase 3'-5' endonuclease subunit Ccr4
MKSINSFKILDEVNEEKIEKEIKKEKTTFTIPPNNGRKFTKKKVMDGEHMKVISYNILCPSYAKEWTYPYCDYKALEWQNRKKYILQELLSYDSQIICLQEVEDYSYFTKSLKNYESGKFKNYNSKKYF